jgi:hypothetical protein
MAVTLTFGLVFATALTLVIVPNLNMIFFDIRRVFRKLRRRRTEEDHYFGDDTAFDAQLSAVRSQESHSEGAKQSPAES